MGMKRNKKLSRNFYNGLSRYTDDELVDEIARRYPEGWLVAYRADRKFRSSRSGKVIVYDQEYQLGGDVDELCYKFVEIIERDCDAGFGEEFREGADG